MTTNERTVAVIGGGVSGLTTAYLLAQAKPEWRITVLEKEPEVGGKVTSRQQGGYTFDGGPNGFLTNVPETLELAKSLGLESDLQRASDSAKYRFIYKDGGLRPLPASPPKLLTTDLLSPFGKLRAAAEFFLGEASDQEETVYTFLRRHFGVQVADTFAGVVVSGITAGDAKELSLDALFPRFRAVEREHGSLLKGLIQRQREAKNAPRPDGRLTSLQGGIGRLIGGLKTSLGDRVNRGVGVKCLSPVDGGYGLELSTGETFTADTVVLATPAFVSAKLLRPFLPNTAKLLKSIPYADVRVFGLGYDRIDVPHALDGFGFLVPRGEGVRSLGVLWTSSIFPGRAPEGKVMLRVICGGTLEPDFIALSDEEALRVVRHDLRVTMGITAKPEFVARAKWANGIPQYLPGHPEKVATVMDAVGAHKGLHLTGNAYYGVGVNDSVRDAHRVMKEMMGDEEKGSP